MPIIHRLRLSPLATLLLSATTASLVIAGRPSPAQAQWFGPNCRSLAQEQLQAVGPRLTELYAAAARQDGAAIMGLALSGSYGAITFNRPIEVRIASVEATPIERNNVQTTCRVRAPGTITFERPGIWIEQTPSGPRLQRGSREDVLEGELTYDFVFAGREVLQNGLDAYLIAAMVLFSRMRQREEEEEPQVARLIREEQAEQQRRTIAARDRAENERLIRDDQQRQEQLERHRRASIEAETRNFERSIQQARQRIEVQTGHIATYQQAIERLQFPSRAVGSGLDAASDRESRARNTERLTREIARAKHEIEQLELQIQRLDEARTKTVASIGAPTATTPRLTLDNIRTTPTLLELAVITAWASRCFDVPAAVRGEPLATPVRVRIRFAPDGSLAAAPEATEVGTSQVDRMLSDAGVRAVRRCANEGPIRLPRERYEAWRDVTLTFTPN